MDECKVREAASILAAAWRSNERGDQIPGRCAPASVEEAHAIQDALTEELGERVAGWKGGTPKDGIVMRGAIYQSRTFRSPAVIAAALTPLLGVEAEIAFRFNHELSRRPAGYCREELAEVVTAFAGLEVVDSRFRSYDDAPFFDRAADLMSNGAYVLGTGPADWRAFDLNKLEVVLTVGRQEVVRRAGGHAANDPMLPVLTLANEFAKSRSIPAGTYITTGTLTGLHYAKPGNIVAAELIGFGKASVTFAA